MAIPAVIATVRFTPIIRRMTDAGDFPAHTRFAQEIAATGTLPVPHFAYHLLLVAVHAVLPGAGWPTAALVVTMGGLLVTTMILAWWIRDAVPGPVGVQLVLAAILPLALLTVQPVLRIGPLDYDPWLIGYFPANQWHNPTTLFSKPVALALFGFGLQAAFGPRGAGWRRMVATAALVVLSGLIKPVFLMAFLPAVGFAALVNLRRSDWKLLSLGLAVPGLLLLLWQYWRRYRIPAGLGPSVVWAPLDVVGLYEPTDAVSLISKLGASVLFPATVTLLFFPSAIRDRRLMLAWGVFACGAAYSYLLTEGGGRESDGNFLWSGQLGAFLLIAAAAVFVARVCTTAGRFSFVLAGRVALTALILLWHVESGVRHLQTSWLPRHSCAGNPGPVSWRASRMAPELGSCLTEHSQAIGKQGRWTPFDIRNPCNEALAAHVTREIQATTIRL